MSTAELAGRNELMTPGQVARLFSVTPKTIARWHDAGILPAVRTPGGHRRFSAAAVARLVSDLAEVGDG